MCCCKSFSAVLRLHGPVWAAAQAPTLRMCTCLTTIPAVLPAGWEQLQSTCCYAPDQLLLLQLHAVKQKGK